MQTLNNISKVASPKSKQAIRQFSENIVKIKYDDLISNKNPNELFTSIEAAYGKYGLGIMVIQDVPEYLQAKQKLFNLIFKLTNLPKEKLLELERPEISYSLGWSHGKEYFNDKPDFFKASYYAQLLQYNSSNPVDNNIWPESMPELKSAFFELGGIIRNTSFNLYGIIDSYIKNIYPEYNLNYRKIIEDSRENTGRMLYYFPKNKAKDMSNVDGENWCEWHNDHGSLTGLASASYVDFEGNESSVKLSQTGLYIQNRNGDVIRTTYGKNDIAFQVGETLQIHSGGLLQATPHAVKVMDDIPDDIGRVTFALFMEPNKDFDLKIPKGADIADVKTSEIYKVPKLQDRYKEGMTFGDFCDATFNTFYKN